MCLRGSRGCGGGAGAGVQAARQARGCCQAAGDGLACDLGARSGTWGALGKASWENSPSIRTDSAVDITGGWVARA